jgi:hypothetical protein
MLIEVIVAAALVVPFFAPCVGDGLVAFMVILLCAIWSWALYGRCLCAKCQSKEETK